MKHNTTEQNAHRLLAWMGLILIPISAFFLLPEIGSGVYYRRGGWQEHTLLDHIYLMAVLAAVWVWALVSLIKNKR